MRKGQKGFTAIELIVASAIIALIGSAAMTTTFQIFNCNERNNNEMAVIRQVQNAGYWISRDARMADTVVTDNLSSDDFMILSWTERDYESDDVYHSVTYYFTGLSDHVGTLMRNHWSSAGLNADTRIADYIAYDPGDPVNTSNVSYQNEIFTVKITATYEDAGETREYQISRRTNFN